MQDTPEAERVKSKSFNPGLVHTWKCSRQEQRIAARDKQNGPERGKSQKIIHETEKLRNKCKYYEIYEIKLERFITNQKCQTENNTVT